MKKQHTIFTFIFLIITSCNFSGPIDHDIQTKDFELNENDLIGIWKLDDFSYKYLSEIENLDSIHLHFKVDSAFQINNSKDLFNEKEDLNSIMNGKLDNLVTKGSWKKDDENEVILNLNNQFDIRLKIFKKDNNYQLWYFYGDPDSGERLRFLKQ